MIDKFETDGSDWVLNKPLKFTVRFIRYFDRFNRARGLIETPDWLKNRGAIINIQNSDDNCFLKCIYRYFNSDGKHDHRDIPMNLVNTFMAERGIDLAIFNNGITSESLRIFEEITKIGINIFYIDERGPEYSMHDDVSIYNDQEYDPMINLGYITNDDKSHSVIITKLNCIVSEKYYSHKKLIFSMCTTIFSNREARLNHSKNIILMVNFLL
jgi:hypothetical protein